MRHDAVIWDNEATPLSVVDAAIDVLVVPLENKVGLLSVVVSVSNVAEQAFTELCLGQRIKSSEVEELEGG